jgi:hypothetical protein
MERVSQAELARRLNVTPSAIARAVREGRVEVGPDGLVDVAAGRAQWLANRQRRPRRSRSAEPGLGGLAEPPSAVKDSGQFWDARTRREHAEAELAELKAAEQRGDLMRRDAIVRELAPRLVELRDALEVLSERLGNLVAVESDPTECRRMIRDEIRAALAAFTRGDAASLAGAAGEEGVLQ